MGCDIHLKLEIRQIANAYETRGVFKDGEIREELISVFPDSYARNWHPVRMTSHCCWSDRVYGMFAILADVRNHFSRKIVPIMQRGFPEDACENTKDAYCCFVVSDEKYDTNPDYYKNSCFSWVPEREANVWVEKGYSKEIDTKPFGNSTIRRISGPDWHSPNWCTTKEMEDCIKEIFWNEKEQKWTGDYIEWFALLGAMKGVESSGSFECRAVFWFDN